MTYITLLPLGDVPAAQEVVDTMRLAGADKHPVLTELRRDVFRGGSVWVLHGNDHKPLSVHCSRVGKRKKNAWEPYMTWWGAYTLPDYRRSGYATVLYEAAELAALTAGCRRVKSLAGSSAGLGLHKALGHACWGLNDNNEVWVDSPLSGFDLFYQDMGRPHQAPGPLMKNSELKALIKQGLRYDTQT